MDTEQLDLLPFEEYMRSLNRKRMSAGVLFYDEAGRILLIEPSYKPHWDIPGGTVDAEEAPWTTAKREVHEELGWTKPLGRVLLIDYAPTNERMSEGLAFVLDGGLINQAKVDALVITDPEILSTGLYDLDQAASMVNPTVAKRLTAAMSAMRAGDLALCENGRRAQ